MNIIHLTVDENPPEKRFKFSFDTESDDEENDETVIQMDCMSFLKKSCQNDPNNLDELKQHPRILKLFITFNSIISSTSTAERLLPLNGKIFCKDLLFSKQEATKYFRLFWNLISDLIEKSQRKLFDEDLFCKLARLRAR